MPRQKRALNETTANEQPKQKKAKKLSTDKSLEKENVDQSNPKKTKKSTTNKEPEKKTAKQKKQDKADVCTTDTDDDMGMPDIPPHEYICMVRPYYDWEAENDAKDEDHQLDDDELADKYNNSLKGRKLPSEMLLNDNPNEKWVCMWETWKKYCDWKIRAQHRNQDSFGMHIYNDWNGYGLQECVENMIVEFDNEFRKKDKNLKQLWAISTAMAHWLTQADTDEWSMTDDGERYEKTIKMVGVSFLSLLNELDLAGELKPVSEFKDLALIMAVYLSWTPGDIYDESCGDWRKHVFAYAKRADIDLSKSVLAGMQKTLGDLEKQHGQIKALTGKASADRWKYKKEMTDFEHHWSHGGEQYNILKMTKAERKKYSLDGKDPLAGVPQKEIDRGRLMLA